MEARGWISTPRLLGRAGKEDRDKSTTSERILSAGASAGGVMGGPEEEGRALPS